MGVRAGVAVAPRNRMDPRPFKRSTSALLVGPGIILELTTYTIV